jgi:two-component system chemotaxis response regulator CheB
MVDSGKIRVLVVDDAVVMRRLISEALSKDPAIEVVGTAPNGRIALAKVDQLSPDILTLDVEMPELDGVQTVRALRKTRPQLPVIMFSTLTQRGALTTLEALSAGASDYVTKPANVGSVLESMSRLQEELVPKIKALCRRRAGLPLAPPVSPPVVAIPVRTSPAAPVVLQRRPEPVEVLCIGTSTGGPNALVDLFGGIPAGFPVPVLIVQHMPPLFTQMLAERLGKGGRLRFTEGAEGQPVLPGHVYIAPGGRHMEVVRRSGAAFIRLHDGPPENSCRPAVDVLFRSVAACYGGRSLAVILTGMGQDGLRGCEVLRRAGARIVIQDEASSVVWGMPGAVAQAGLYDRMLPLPMIASEINRSVSAPAAPALVAG